jgi:CheY-like chemotaxis protein
VQAVYGGQAAIETAPSFRPDLVLLDIGLPFLDGYEVATRLRAAGFRSTLVALSGYGQKEDIERALQAGFDAHLTKPVEPTKLEEILHKVCESKEATPRPS